MDTEMITTKTVVDLAEKTSPVDTDLFMAGDAGSAALKKFKWSNLLAAIKTKIAAWTFETLNTSNKTIVGAVNELNNNMTQSSGSITQGTESWSNAQRTIWQKNGRTLHLSGVIKANVNSNTIVLGGLPLAGFTINNASQCFVYCSSSTSKGERCYVATVSKSSDSQLTIALPENATSGEFAMFDFIIELD